ncbi:MAG: glucose 1-dehydrogenase [Spirochaetes bacterium]|nr:glucose 1-dehydrogenase [Spirochaetota bacterium]
MSGSNMFDLTGRIALVTGGGTGMGRCFCEGLAEFGADVAIADIDEDAAKETAGLVEKAGRKAIVIKTDVTKSSEVENMVSETVKQFGKIDILLNNAGAIMGLNLIHETPEELWDKIIALNFKAAFLCTKAVIPVMQKQKKGSIINTASVGIVLPGDPDMKGSIYDAAKGGLAVFSRKAASEYGRDGIRINAIAPGMIPGTNFGAERKKLRGNDTTAADKLQHRISTIALGRPGKPEEIKGIVIYLASDAASYTTGQVFVIDGGMS